jgi:hypothetical protein
MTDREHKLDTGTIGSAPCEVALNGILINLENPKVTRKIMSRHTQLRVGLERLQVLRQVDHGFFLRMALMFYEQQITAFKRSEGCIPKDAYTHALCCYKALYRKAIR